MAENGRGGLMSRMPWGWQRYSSICCREWNSSSFASVERTTSSAPVFLYDSK
jgi:hypothetical protein